MIAACRKRNGRRHRAGAWHAACLLLALGMSGAVAEQAGIDAAWRGAIQSRDADAVADLLAAHPGELDVNATPEAGTSALMVAAKAGRGRLVDALLDAGAAVNARSRSGGAALMFAAQSGEPAVVSRLLAAGARLDAAADNGWTALTVAAALGNATLVRLLLARGADPAVQDVYGWTPLSRAADNGHAAAVRALVEQGHGDIGARNDAGMTALHHAARQGHREVVRVLTAHGASAGARDKRGRTPLSIARDTGDAALVALLRRQSRRH